MIKCSSRKKVYPTLEMAEDALIEAHVHFDYGTRSGPIAVYECEDCGYYHMTSKGTMNLKLVAYQNAGQVRRQKEANHWLDKLKRN